MLLVFWLINVALAAEYFLEIGPVADRTVATEAQVNLKSAGIESRIVRRFRLGHGWEFVLLVEHLPNDTTANNLAAQINQSTGQNVQVYLLNDETATETTANNTPAPPKETVADLLVRSMEAHGGKVGGVAALSRAEAVHFSFDRILTEGGTRQTYHHDYWREGANRRLVIDGPETDSLAIATATGSWLKATGAHPTTGVISRDIGVMINQMDSFAPEAVLAVAIDAWHLLTATETQSFRVLDGPEGSIRVGAGSTEEEPGLSFMDLDPTTKRITRVRYITEGGPVEYTLSQYKEVSPGLWVPFQVEVERGDGRRETITVKQIELAPAAPSGSFDKPV